MCFRLYKQLRQSVNMCASSFGYLVDISLNVLWMAISYALKHVCSHGSLFKICMSILVELYIQYPAFSFFQCPLVFWEGGIMEPSV